MFNKKMCRFIQDLVIYSKETAAKRESPIRGKNVKSEFSEKTRVTNGTNICYFNSNSSLEVLVERKYSDHY